MIGVSGSEARLHDSPPRAGCTTWVREVQYRHWEMIFIVTTLTRGHVKAGDKIVEVTKVRVTDEGCGGLEES